MTWSFSIGRLLGSELRVHVTFFLLLAWIGAAAWQTGGAPAALENVLFVLALFVCVVAHEFGHALVARRYGIRTPDITLLPIGGMARLERMPERPAQEIAVALAGPAVSIAIWAALSLALGVRARLDLGQVLGGAGTDFAARLAALNLFLALFNLLPAFPMDGGRVLRAALALRMDRVRATRWAARTGQALAFVLGFVGFTSGNPILLLIAFFVFIAAGAESGAVTMNDLARRMTAREAMITRFEALAPEDTLGAAGQALIRTTQHEFPVLDAEGRPLGVLTRAALYTALQESPAMRQVGAVMQTPLPQVPLTAGLEPVLEALHGGAPAVAVCGADGRMIGYVTRENIGELMVLQGRRGG